MRAITESATSAKPAPTGPELKAVPSAPAAAPKAAPVSARPAARPGLPPDAWATLVLCALPLALTAWGWSYYAAPLGVRLRHPLHALLKPSGPVGLGLGIAALAFFLFMWLYPFRKSIKALAWTGTVGSWMRVHIVAGLAVPVIAAAHAGWRFDGLIGLGYLSMIVVSLSGVVGRYLYVHIPRSRNGLEMTMEDVSNERRALITNIAAATGLVPADVERRLAVDTRPYEGLDPLRTIVRMFKDDARRGRTIRELKAELSRPRAGRGGLGRGQLGETMRLARRELSLAQQVRMLDGTRRVFGYWHVAHRPFAITALIAVLVHVVVAMTIGGVGFAGGH
jgi:hypothetical protein